MGFEINGDIGLPWKWRFRKGMVLGEEKEKQGAMEGSITKEIAIVGVLDLLLIWRYAPSVEDAQVLII